MSKGTITVRKDTDGTVDEIVARGVDIHLERMSGKTYTLLIHGKKRTQCWAITMKEPMFLSWEE